ncbi:MAG: rhomboid family intramembrane serine protease [Rhodothermales bacterium]
MYQDTYRPQFQFSVFPPVLKNLLIINGLFFLGQMAYNSPLSLFLEHWFALWPLGAPDVLLTPAGPRSMANFWPWQLVTYGFLHGDFFHLLFNMFALWMFGVQLENTWGSRRFGIFYFICVIGAGLVQLAVQYVTGSYAVTIGASGGVYGVLMAFGMTYPNQIIYLNFFIPVKAKWFVLGMGLISLFSGATGASAGVAHFAHLGGMVFGFLLLLYWRGKLPVRPGKIMH